MPKKKKKVVKKKKLTSDKDIALDFATKAYQKFRDVIKAIAMFGSATKGEAKEKSDIDLIIIIDDCTVNWDEELIAWYREELSKLLAEQKYKKDLHLNTVTLTAFWEEVREGEPLVINVLRYGETLVDLGGFFDPLKVLLAKGRIRPSAEAIFTTLQRSGQHLGRANVNILNSVEGYYWAMVDASHAALMAQGIVPPSPEHVAELLESTLVKKKILKKDYIEWFEYARKKAKLILHGEINKISGEELQEIQKNSHDFVRELHLITKSLIRNEKIIKYELKK